MGLVIRDDFSAKGVAMEGFLSAQAPEFVRMKPLWKGGPGICLLGGFCVHTPLRTPEPEGQL